jgi:YesN/AraC family two-component response regulator
MAHIMIVDDEDLLRQTLRHILEAAGHEVLDASNGNECLKALETQAVDVVITDIVMPEKEGIELIADIRRSYPDLKILAISAGAWGGKFDYLETATKLGAHAALAKPFTADQIRQAVADCLT